ncbi:MAG: hypothetical protein LBD06_03740 [Candidatus Accumulibacter sp.]|nr:hypothetical protein [Accumulibacter sp.]
MAKKFSIGSGSLDFRRGIRAPIPTGGAGHGAAPPRDIAAPGDEQCLHTRILTESLHENAVGFAITVSRMAHFREKPSSAPFRAILADNAGCREGIQTRVFGFTGDAKAGRSARGKTD